jgi:hypothetical protein
MEMQILKLESISHSSVVELFWSFILLLIIYVNLSFKILQKCWSVKKFRNPESLIPYIDGKIICSKHKIYTNKDR